MKELIISEQEIIFGGNGVASVIGSGLASGISGGSPGCAAIGTLSGIAMGTSPMGVVAGASVSAYVSGACNNRSRTTSGPVAFGGLSGNSSGYWPSVKGGQHRPNQHEMKLFNRDD